MRELDYRQRNIVFPETAMNGARYWANLTSRKYPFTRGQKIGFTCIFVTAGSLLFAFVAGGLKLLVLHPTDVELWVPELPSLAIAALIGFLLWRAFFAVFGHQRFPELPASARRNLLIQRSKRTRDVD